MKTNKGIPDANSRKSAKVPHKAKASESLKPSPSVKNFAGTKAKSRTNGMQSPKAFLARKSEVLHLESAEPPNDAAQPLTHSADAIRARAYMNYLKRGAGDGDHTDDWLRAEAELTAERRGVSS